MKAWAVKREKTEGDAVAETEALPETEVVFPDAADAFDECEEEVAASAEPTEQCEESSNQISPANTHLSTESAKRTHSTMVSPSTPCSPTNRTLSVVNKQPLNIPTDAAECRENALFKTVSEIEVSSPRRKKQRIFDADVRLAEIPEHPSETLLQKATGGKFVLLPREDSVSV